MTFTKESMIKYIQDTEFYYDEDERQQPVKELAQKMALWFAEHLTDHENIKINAGEEGSIAFHHTTYTIRIYPNMPETISTVTRKNLEGGIYINGPEQFDMNQKHIFDKDALPLDFDTFCTKVLDETMRLAQAENDSRNEFVKSVRGTY